MKTCNTCAQTKELSEFYYIKSTNKFTGICLLCRDIARKQYYKNNRKRELAVNQNYMARNRDKILAYMREYTRQYVIDNRHYYNAHCAKRKATILKATPPWFNELEVTRIYRKAYILRRCGSDVHVDHIIPLQSKTVSGLHCAANLQIISAADNLSKGNKFAA